jgi:ABC-2 type transport system permease protein
VTAIRVELAKLLGLPAVWVGVAVGVLLPAGITVLNARHPAARVTSDVGFHELAVGAIAAIVIGVVAISSEYHRDGDDGGRQITTSLTCVASRGRFLTAKAVALIMVVASLATVSGVATVVATHRVLGGRAVTALADDLARIPAVALYWVLTALLAFAFALLTRSGVVPMIVLIVNASAVSVSLLMSFVTPLADYFPDRAGSAMFITTGFDPPDVSPLVGGLVMAAWAFAALALSARAFHRRDA